MRSNGTITNQDNSEIGCVGDAVGVDWKVDGWVGIGEDCELSGIVIV